MDYKNPCYLKNAQCKIPCLYDVKCVKSNDIVHKFMNEFNGSLQLAAERRPTFKDKEIKPIDYKKLNKIYDDFIPQSKNQTKNSFSQVL